MRTLYFGGTFNPIHHGHLICARAVAEKADFERIVLMPNRAAPHKSADAHMAGASHRLEMCHLAAEAGGAMFATSDLELVRAGPSYTLDTVRQLKEQGAEEVHWLIGADMLRYLPNWREPEKLMREARFVLVARPGWAFDWGTMPAAYRHLEKDVVEAPLIEISATDIRQRVGEGKSIEFLVPPAVAGYIEEHRLYRRQQGGEGGL